jgi:2-aminoethylphosphonate-pyruvate transaminase
VGVKELIMRAFQGPDGQEDMPYLLTTGPVTTSRKVKLAMLADFGAYDADIISATRFARQELLTLAGASAEQSCVLLQGSALFAKEAVIGALCPTRRKKTLVIANGSDGESAAVMMERLARPHLRLTYKETSMPKAAVVAKTLDDDRSISHVWLTHCETSTGMLNPIAEIAEVVKAKNRVMIVDAAASFGGIALDMSALKIDVLIGTVDACLESLPGLSFIVAPNVLLDAAAGQSHSVVLDLHAQWKNFEANERFVTTAPTQSLVALREALRELTAEGGVQKRAQRYQDNANTLRERLSALGLSLLLDHEAASPIVQTVLAPRAATFDFMRFDTALRAKGFAICPGVFPQRASFRIGCIGKVDEKVMQQLTSAIENALNDMDVRSFAPAAT